MVRYLPDPPAGSDRMTLTVTLPGPSPLPVPPRPDLPTCYLFARDWTGQVVFGTGPTVQAAYEDALRQFRDRGLVYTPPREGP